MDSKLIIKMFGEFSIYKDNKLLIKSSGRTRQVWNLFEYLIANRHQDVSQEKLIEILWPHEQSDNPANALKNLIYRLRTMLRTLDKYGEEEYILFSRNTYHFNNDISCYVDIEEFEILYRKAMECTDKYKKRFYLLKLIQIYQGDFLPNSSSEVWVISRREYYKNLFMESVNTVCRIFSEEYEYSSVIPICEKAIEVDPFEESIHIKLIDTYMKMEKPQKALDHYYFATDLFVKNLGVDVSDEIKELYKQILAKTKNPEANIEAIKQDLKETCAKGAFFCEYEIFKYLYRLEARNSVREDKSIYIVLISVRDTKGEVPEIKVLTEEMNILKTVILSNLRKGDVVSRFSSSQYIIMLQQITPENADKVVKRLFDNYYNNDMSENKVKLLRNLKPLDPISL